MRGKIQDTVGDEKRNKINNNRKSDSAHCAASYDQEFAALTIVWNQGFWWTSEMSFIKRDHQRIPMNPLHLLLQPLAAGNEPV